jgi:hypothetical protein
VVQLLANQAHQSFDGATLDQAYFIKLPFRGAA